MIDRLGCGSGGQNRRWRHVCADAIAVPSGRQDLRQGAFTTSGQGRIGALFDPIQAQHDRIQFLLRKRQRWQEESRLQVIANAGLALQRRTERAQGVDIPVDASLRYPQLGRQRSCRHRPSVRAQQAKQFKQAGCPGHPSAFARQPCIPALILERVMYFEVSAKRPMARGDTACAAAQACRLGTARNAVSAPHSALPRQVGRQRCSALWRMPSRAGSARARDRRLQNGQVLPARGYRRVQAGIGSVCVPPPPSPPRSRGQ